MHVDGRKQVYDNQCMRSLQHMARNVASRLAQYIFIRKKPTEICSPVKYVVENSAW
jgi:hypothetical protein